MKFLPISVVFAAVVLTLPSMLFAEQPAEQIASAPQRIDIEQVPTWSQDDLKFFLHGSMSTEVFPEPVLRAFCRIYPEFFPTNDFTHLGLIADPEFGWPIGISRKRSEERRVGKECRSRW